MLKLKIHKRENHDQSIKTKIIARLLEDPKAERKTAGGLILAGDDATEAGIRARWFQTISVGEEVLDIKENQYILVDHGRWTRGIEVEGEKVFGIDVDSILGTSEDRPAI